MLDTIRDKALHGKRLDRAEGRWLLAEAPPGELRLLRVELKLLLEADQLADRLAPRLADVLRQRDGQAFQDTRP